MLRVAASSTHIRETIMNAALNWPVMVLVAVAIVVVGFRMPQKCNGIDAIPGGGAVTGFFEDGETYHVSADGLVIGSVKPGAPSGNQTGWLDNTSAVVANRGPDGLIDLFVEDSYLHRFLWHRVNDKDIQTTKVAVERR
jgi:hypothetical protein